MRRALVAVVSTVGIVLALILLTLPQAALAGPVKTEAIIWQATFTASMAGAVPDVSWAGAAPDAGADNDVTDIFDASKPPPPETAIEFYFPHPTDNFKRDIRLETQAMEWNVALKPSWVGAGQKLVTISWNMTEVPVERAVQLFDATQDIITGDIIKGAVRVNNMRTTGLVSFNTTKTTRFFVFAASINQPPSVTVTYPNGGELVSGTANVTATASDADGTVTQVAFEYSADNGATWTAIATDTTAPYSAPWDTTTLADGSQYLVRAASLDDKFATATDVSNATFSVANPPSVAVTSPNGGEIVSGTVAVSANASVNGGSITQVAFDYSSNRGESWNPIGTDTTAPYSVSWNTTALTDGDQYLIRATAIADNSLTAQDVSDATFIVDNTAPGTPNLTSPFNGAVVTTNTPAFDWSNVLDASGITYSLQVDDDPAFGSPALDISGLTQSDFSYSGGAYATDFSVDPQWVTSNPSGFYWDATGQRYHYRLVGGSSDYAYAPVAYGGGAFRLAFDLLPTRTDYAASHLFGISAPNLRNEPGPAGSKIFVRYVWDVGGVHFWLLAFDDAGQGSTSAEGFFSNNVSYRNEITYLPGSAALVVTRLDTGAEVGTYTLSGLGAISGMDRLYLSVEGIGGGNTGAVAEGYVDNVALWQMPVAATAAVTVPSNSWQPWADTGLAVSTGDIITVTASGSVTYAPTSSPVGPNGSGGPGGTVSHLVTSPQVPEHSLVGNIAATPSLDGYGFFVGADFTQTVPIPNTTSNTGKLFLGFNDGFVEGSRTGMNAGAVGDNSGSFSANVTVFSGLSDSALPTGTYYWRVKAVEASGYLRAGPWSSPFSFAIAGAPTVTITYPNGGEKLWGNVTVSTNASDSDGAVTQVAFDYSSNNGSTWHAIAADTSGTDGWSVSWNTSLLSPGPGYLVRATVSDNDSLTSSDISDAVFTVVQPVTRITSDPAGDYDPAATQTADGKIWVVWSRNGDIRYKTSSNNGTIWSAGARLTTEGAGDSYPAITQTADGKVWVAWARQGDIWYRSSADGGSTWSANIRLTTDPAYDDYPSMTQTSDGKVWFTWRSDRSGNSDIWYKTSPDSGASWSADTQLTTDPSWDYYPSITRTSDGKIWVVWTRNGNTWYKTSSDNGTTWSAEAQLTADPSGAYVPSLSQTSDGGIWLAWASPGQGGYDIWYKTSSDNGTTWSPDTRFTRFVGWDDWSSVAALADGRLGIVWTSDRAGNADIWLGSPGFLEDVNPPPVGEALGHFPLNPADNQEVTVRAWAGDETGIASVALVWWVDNVAQPELPMYNDGTHGDEWAGDSEWAAQIGPFPAGSVVEYRIRITDADGNVVLVPSISFTSLAPWVAENSMLLVLDSASTDTVNNYTPYYKTALDSLGVGYDIWDTNLRGGPAAGDLAQYLDGAGHLGHALGRRLCDV